MNFLRRSNPVQAVGFLTSGLLFFTMAPAFAQEYPPTQGYPSQGYPAQQNYPPPPTFAPGQLENVVSRIALYPDPLLAQIFAAATFPDQISDAARFADEHQNLRGDDLANEIAVANLPFDPAVQALIPFPQVLDMMASDMNWTNELGNAVLADRAAVMDAVQRERASAQRYGYLQNTPQMRVEGGPGDIQIEPVDPGVIYVPVYDPYLVYAPPRPGFYVGSAIRFSPGFAIGFGFSHWGGGFNWAGHSVIVRNQVWGRTWYNRGSYATNWRNAPVNRNVTVNNYNVNRNVNRADYNVNRTENINRYTNNYVRNDNVQNSQRNFYRGNAGNNVTPNADLNRTVNRTENNNRYTNNYVLNDNVQNSDRNVYRGNTVAPNAGVQRQAEPNRQAFRPTESGRVERGFAPVTRESHGGGERSQQHERGGRR